MASSLLDLPPEIVRSVLLKLPPAEVINKINFVNKQLHSQVTKEEFWKELCLVRYYWPKSSLSKPPLISWQNHAFELENALIWKESAPELHIINKSYSLSYPASQASSSASKAPEFLVGVASKPLVAGPFSRRYFEVVVDSLSAGDEILQMVIGLAPHNILLNPSFDKVYGYTNTGKANNSTFGKPYGIGDRIGILLNTEYMTVSFLKNDVLQGTPYVHLDKHIPFHPVVGIMKAGVQVTIPLPPLKDAPAMPLR